MPVIICRTLDRCILRIHHATPLDAENIATIGVESGVMTASILLTQGYMRLDWLAKRNL